MFDTIKLAVPDIDIDVGRLYAPPWRITVPRENSPTIGQRDLSPRYHRFRDDNNQVDVTYSPSSGTLTAETSLPKLFYGNNAKLLSPSDVSPALDSLSNQVSDLVRAPIPHCGDWHLRGRLDACYAWQVGERRVPDYLHALSRLHLARHRTDYIDSAGSVYWKTARRWLRSYSKYAETPIPAARGLLRFEVEMKRAKSEMKQVAGVADNAKARDILTWENAERVLGHWLDALGTDLVITSDEKLITLLEEKCGRTAAVRLWGFISLARTYGRDELLARGYKRNYVWRNMKRVAGAGASIAGSESGLLPGLRLPAKYDGEAGRPSGA